MMRILLLGVVLAALLAPAGVVLADQEGTQSSGNWDDVLQGVPGHLDIVVAPDAIKFSLEEITIDGDYASQLRHEIDMRLGNGDGIVSEDEARTAQSLFTAYVNSQLPRSFDLEMVSIDGRNPYSADHSDVTLESLKINGAEGDIMSTAPISVDISVLMRFETVGRSSTHELAFENIWGDLGGVDLDDVPDMEVRVQGYRSWTIIEDSLQPSAMQERYNDGMLVFTVADTERFKASGDGLWFEIRGDPDDRLLGEVEESPAPAPLVVLFLLAFALVRAARRR